jgi:hypothetical protein
MVASPIVLLVLGAAAVAVLAGCGGGDDGPRLSRAAYTEQANAECTKLKQASDDLQLAQAPGATGAKVSDYLERAADGLAGLADGLDSLTPPAAIESDADDLGAALADYGDGLESLAGKVGKNETFADALDANQPLVRRLNTIAERATRLVGKLGIDGCQLAG